MGKAIKWDFTNKCNLRCIHCSAAGSHFAPDVRRISLAQKLRVVDNLSKADVAELTLLGGEPLTSKDFFPVASYAASKGIAVTVVTNGILLSDANIARIIDSGINTVVISLDGASALTHDHIRGKGSFDKTIPNIRRLVSRVKETRSRVKTKMNTVVNKINHSEIDEMFELGRRLEVNELSFLALTEVGRAAERKDELVLTPEESIDAAVAIGRKFNALVNKDLYPEIRQQIANPLVCDYIRQKYGIDMPGSYVSTICCLGGISLGYVTPDGDLFPCDRIVADRYVGRPIRGAIVERRSLLTDDFDDIWSSDYFAKMFELVVDDNTYRNYRPCSNCEYLKTRQCNPCPLDSGENVAAFGSCLIAAKALDKVRHDSRDSNTSDNILSGFTSYKYGLDTSDDELYQNMRNMIPEKASDLRLSDRGDGTTIIFNPHKTELCRLVPITRFMWDLINDKNTVSDIAAEIEEILRSVRDRLHVEDDGYYAGGAVKERVANYFQGLSDAGFVVLNPQHEEVLPEIG